MKRNFKKADNFQAAIPEIEKKIGYTFKDKALLLQAFTRTSFCNENIGEGGIKYQSNEVLEFFGDSVLGTAIISVFMKDLSERYEFGIRTELGEGDFSNIKSKLSDKKNLSERIEELGLYKYFRMGEGDRKLGIEREMSVMEDLFESIVGAVYIDSGMNIGAVIRTVSVMLDVKKYIGSSTRDKKTTIQSYKNALQEWCADKKRRLPPPVYKTVGESGPDHKKIYERACYIGDRLYAVGRGKNQKLADSDAAEKTLAILTEEAQPKPKMPDPEAERKLKEYSRSQHITSPTFRDLGEAENSTPQRRQYSVMCLFSGVETTATAEDKSLARCAAAEKALILVKNKNKHEHKKHVEEGPKRRSDSAKDGLRVNKTAKKRAPHKMIRKEKI